MRYTANLEQQIDPVASTISKLSYQLFQQGKSYFGLTHKTLSTRLTNLFVKRGRGETEAISPQLLAHIQSKLNQMLEVDWQDAQDGVYPVELLFDNPWEDFWRYYPGVWLDMPSIWQRLNNKQYQEFSPEIDQEGYPGYYLQNFHHQTDGYLSDQSANLYDLQVEILFNGSADAMRRRILAPLKAELQGLAAAGDKQLKILDVACGTGRTLKMLRGAFPETSLFGVDLSPAYLRKANQLLAKNPGELPQLAQANAEELPYQDNYFHGVTSVFLFHELPPEARQNVIQECFRVTQPGGTFVICDSVQAIDSPEFKPMMANFPLTFHEPYYRSYISDDLVERLKQVGFEKIAIQNHFMSKYWIAHKPA